MVDEKDSKEIGGLSQRERPAYKGHEVWIEMPEGEGATTPQARIRSKDGTIDMLAPVDMVRRRFRHGERSACFRARVKGGIGVLEIEDRIETPTWAPK